MAQYGSVALHRETTGGVEDWHEGEPIAAGAAERNPYVATSHRPTKYRAGAQ